MNTSLRIVTRADDAGSSRSANRAIRATCLNGICRNVGLMANGAHVEDAVTQLADLKGIAFGLHGTLTSEWEWPRWGPLSDPAEVPSLILEDGTFPRTTPDLHKRGARPEEVQKEIERQLDRLTRLGFPIVYMDEHMGFGWPEELGTALTDFARRKGLIFRPKLARLPKPEDATSPGSLADTFLAALKGANPGTYLVVGHPCYDDEETRSIQDPANPPGFHGTDRNEQRRVFMRADVVAYFDSRTVEVQAIRYDEI